MRAKHGGNIHSLAAWESVLPTLRLAQQGVMQVVLSRTDVTPKETAAAMGVPFNTISGRFSELRNKGLIHATGERRDGSGVWVAVRKPRQLMLV